MPRLSARPPVFAVHALLVACTSKDTATPRAEPAVAEPSIAHPQVSKWVLDPENFSVSFVCKHVFTNVRGMFAKPSGTVTLDDATSANAPTSSTQPSTP